MIGKVAGLGLIALLQMTIWGLGGMLALGGSAAFGAASLASGSGEQLAALSTMAAAAGELQPSADVEFQAALAGGAPAVQAALGAASAALPGGSVQGALIFFGWTIVFFILGYLAYACALAALGALAPNMREGSQYTFFLLLPLMVPLWFSQVFVTDPHGVAATAFSLTPLTSPTSMVTRMAAGGVPTWQPVLAALLLAATCYLFVILAARFFRADTLLSAEALTWRRLRNELLPNRR
jgi:ABC-type Na+ efflux pump permease subunit